MSFDNYDRLLESEYVNYDDDERRFSSYHPVRGYFVHSDQDFFSTVHHRDGAVGSISSCSIADRPASSPAFYPDLEWYLPPPPPSGAHRSEADDVKTRIDGWISRLDHLISDRPVNVEMTLSSASRATLTSSGSSSSSSSTTKVADEEELEAGESALLPFTGEVPRATDQRRDYLFISPGPPSMTVNRGAARNAEVEARLPVEYQTEDIAVDRKPIITWSKWNVSQIVRGPHEQSPIWNSSLQKKRYDRPNSIVFRELDKEISRRNKELEEIVEKKTELCRRFYPSQNSPPSTSPPSTSPTSSPPVSPQTPVACSSASPYFLSSSSPPSSSSRLSPPVPEPSSQTVGSPGHQILLIHRGSSLESEPSSSHPPVAMTTTTTKEDAEKDEAPRDPPPAAEAAAAAPEVGFGLIRRMVKSFWSIFVGGDGGGCHGDAKNSREALKGAEKPGSG